MDINGVIIAILMFVLGLVIAWNPHAPDWMDLASAKGACQETLPRNQECVLEWKFVPEEKDVN